METVAARVSATPVIPHQPTLASAFPTSSTPDHRDRAMQAAIPAHHTTTLTCFNVPIRTLVPDATLGSG
jgi:hypothetical protein